MTAAAHPFTVMPDGTIVTASAEGALEVRAGLLASLGPSPELRALREEVAVLRDFVRELLAELPGAQLGEVVELVRQLRTGGPDEATKIRLRYLQGRVEALTAERDLWERRAKGEAEPATQNLFARLEELLQRALSQPAQEAPARATRATDGPPVPDPPPPTYRSASIEEAAAAIQRRQERGGHVRATRERLGLSQRELALKVESTQAKISQIELGRVMCSDNLLAQILALLPPQASEPELGGQSE